jgi:hypothetical protein
MLSFSINLRSQRSAFTLDVYTQRSKKSSCFEGIEGFAAALRGKNATVCFRDPFLRSIFRICFDALMGCATPRRHRDPN